MGLGDLSSSLFDHYCHREINYHARCMHDSLVELKVYFVTINNNLHFEKRFTHSLEAIACVGKTVG